MNTNDTKNKENKGASPLAAGLTGAIIGAAGVAAVALSDEETRKKAQKKAVQIKDDLKKWSNQKVKELQKKKVELQDKTEKKVEETKKDTAAELKQQAEDLEQK